ncbi:MAG: hypothetical protein ACKV19_03430 [Verrucomicrobiales bacterium]
MKRHFLIFLTVTAIHANTPQFTDVLTSGQEGYVPIRIPSGVVTKTGTVLAFAEGRPVLASD